MMVDHKIMKNRINITLKDTQLDDSFNDEEKKQLVNEKFRKYIKNKAKCKQRLQRFDQKQRTIQSAMDEFKKDYTAQQQENSPNSVRFDQLIENGSKEINLVNLSAPPKIQTTNDLQYQINAIQPSQLDFSLVHPDSTKDNLSTDSQTKASPNIIVKDYSEPEKEPQQKFSSFRKQATLKLQKTIEEINLASHNLAVNATKLKTNIHSQENHKITFMQVKPCPKESSYVHSDNILVDTHGSQKIESSESSEEKELVPIQPQRQQIPYIKEIAEQSSSTPKETGSGDTDGYKGGLKLEKQPNSMMRSSSSSLKTSSDMSSTKVKDRLGTNRMGTINSSGKKSQSTPSRCITLGRLESHDQNYSPTIHVDFDTISKQQKDIILHQEHCSQAQDLKKHKTLGNKDPSSPKSNQKHSQNAPPLLPDHHQTNPVAQILTKYNKKVNILQAMKSGLSSQSQSLKTDSSFRSSESISAQTKEQELKSIVKKVAKETQTKQKNKEKAKLQQKHKIKSQTSNKLIQERGGPQFDQQGDQSLMKEIEYHQKMLMELQKQARMQTGGLLSSGQGQENRNGVQSLQKQQNYKSRWNDLKDHERLDSLVSNSSMESLTSNEKNLHQNNHSSSLTNSIESFKQRNKIGSPVGTIDKSKKLNLTQSKFGQKQNHPSDKKSDKSFTNLKYKEDNSTSNTPDRAQKSQSSHKVSQFSVQPQIQNHSLNMSQHSSQLSKMPYSVSKETILNYQNKLKSKKSKHSETKPQDKQPVASYKNTKTLKLTVQSNSESMQNNSLQQHNPSRRVTLVNQDSKGCLTPLMKKHESSMVSHKHTLPSPSQVKEDDNISVARSIARRSIRSGARSISRSITTSNQITQQKNKGQKRVNQYLIIKELGKGAFGSVKLVLNENDNKKYAMKVLKKNFLKTKRVSKNEFAIQAVMQEIQIMKALVHPNIIRLHEIMDDPQNNKLRLVMDFHPRGSLKDNLEKNGQNGLEEQKVWHYFRGLVSAIYYCHNLAGIVHRDIKPENVILSSEDQAVLIDFGVSSIFDDPEGDNLQNVIGSMQFFAPELVKPQKDKVIRGKKTDIWALGITLFNLLTNKYPYPATSMFALYTQLMNDEPDLSLIKNELIQDLLKGMLNKDEEKRLTINEIIKHDWVTKNGGAAVLLYEDINLSSEEDSLCTDGSIDSFVNSKSNSSAGRNSSRSHKNRRDENSGGSGNTQGTNNSKKTVQTQVMNVNKKNTKRKKKDLKKVF